MRHTGTVYDFGHFRLDPGEQVLYCAEKPIRLTPKAFEVLRVLIENSGHVVDKDELMRMVWPNAIVEDANLAQTIFVLRKILGESHSGHHSHEYIETVARRGYRFIAAVKVHDEISTRGPIVAESDQGRERTMDAFAPKYTESTEAHHLYLRGRYYWSKYTVDGLKKGIEHFSQATKIDPDYALPYTGLADCYYRLSNIHLPPKKAMPNAREALMKALKLDETIAEAHALLGLIGIFYDRDWLGAESEFKRAIELAPNCAVAHQRYGLVLGLMARFDEAIAEMSHALRLEPLSPQVHIGLGTIFHLARRYEAAIKQAQEALDIDPDCYGAHVLLGITCAQQRKLGEACAELRSAVSLSDLPWTLGYLGYAYGLSGERRQALKILNQLAERVERRYVSPYAMALINVGLGQSQEALRWLERTYEDRNEMLAFVKVSPELDGLRADRRFAGLLKRSRFFAMAA